MKKKKNRNERRKREKLKEIRRLICQYPDGDSKERAKITSRIFQIQSSLWQYHGMDKEMAMQRVEKLLKP